MGIDSSAAIFVGLPQSEIENTDLVAEETLEVCPPHYDGDGEDYAIAGFQYLGTSPYDSKELVWDQAKIDTLKAEFKELTGQDAKVYLSPYIY